MCLYPGFFNHSPVLLHLVFLYLGDCIQCCHDCWCAVSWKFGFLRIHAQVWDGWATWYFVAECLKAPPYCSPEWMHWFTFPPGVGGFPSLHTPSSIYCWIFQMAMLTGGKWYLIELFFFFLIELLICGSLMIRDAEHLFAYFMATWMPSLEKLPFWSLAHFSIVFFLIELHGLFACFGDESLYFHLQTLLSPPILRVVFFFHLWFTLLLKCF